MLGNSQKFISNYNGTGAIGSTQIIAAEKVTADGVLASVPAGYALIAIIINSVGAAGLDLTIESGNLLADILPAESIISPSYNPYSVFFMKNANFVAFDISVRSATGWVNVSLNFYAIIQRIK